MRIVFSREARSEFDEAERYYEKQDSKSGSELTYAQRYRGSGPGRFPVLANAGKYDG